MAECVNGTFSLSSSVAVYKMSTFVSLGNGKL